MLNMQSASESQPAESALKQDGHDSGNWNDIPTDLQSRSPHPYRRSKKPTRPRSPVSVRLSYLPSPADTTPQQSDTESNVPKRPPYRPSHARAPLQSHTEYAAPCPAHAKLRSQTTSPSESGTEADDEAFVKALPAPPLKPRKGLRTGEVLQDDLLGITPSSAPSTHDQPNVDYFGGIPSTTSSTFSLLPQVAPKRHAQFTHSSEWLRRICETICLAGITTVALSGASSIFSADLWGNGLSALLLCYLTPLMALLVAYPLRMAAAGYGLSLPYNFDPAPILYPHVVPFAVAVSLSFSLPSACLLNVILGLSSLPSQLIPAPAVVLGPNAMHWLLSLSPFVLARTCNLSFGIFGFGWNPASPLKPTDLTEELLTLLYPLHQSLLRPLRYLTTSSLLPSELQLLSVALINVLFLAQSPQMVIWKFIVWIGGFGLFVLCGKVLKWNVALERIPSWRFRRAGHIIQASQSFLSALADGLQNDEVPDEGALSGSEPASSATFPSHRISRLKEKAKKRHSPLSPETTSSKGFARKAEGTPIGGSLSKPNSPHRRRPSTSMQVYLSMTHKQAKFRKIIYTVYTYIVILGVVLGPVRMLIAANALYDMDPFGWAIGYLFGDLDVVRAWALHFNLESWVALTPNRLQSPASHWVDSVRYDVLGPANVRLLLFGYFAAILGMGIGLVLALSTSVEVDTRRKVFHGTMVALLLPTAFIDPTFLSLGLVLVLTVFLLLEVIRAAQLRPLSKPLAAFLAPYVDGRDLRGPVVVSHVFLLIGCAVPFWLSLAGISQSAAERPWKGWEVQTRDISMVAGVVCVGMGDAAASLIGRRFGRHKWAWRGGKSLEGSAAFAIAVALGLAASKGMLRAGGWRESWEDGGTRGEWLTKALAAGVASAFAEAVLTGCNDNVVVPVLLWLLVRGLKL